MAAPENNKCEKCGAILPAGAAQCPDCGAPVGGIGPADAESAVYPDLARANLARMRGDYKQAEDQLLAVLRQYPNNPSANEMLGDLAAEREDYPRAVEWYELALDIVPTSASIARKLRDARDRVQKANAQQTSAQIGLPDPSSRVPLLIGAAIIVIIAVAAGAYYLGLRGSSAKPEKPPLVLNAQPQPGSQVTEDPNAPQKPPEGAPPHVADEDQALMQALAKTPTASAILGAVHDPRSGSVTITFAMSGKDDRTLAATVAKDAFAAITANLITVRGVLGGKVAYMADITRERAMQTEDTQWKQAHASDPAAWVGYVLQNEWPSPPPSSGAQTPPGESASTTGSETVTAGGGQ